ncbi:Uncharacterised protein [uncultured archaeon]|nr:Uncharacterised protein [uncultured archaeon]
MVNEINKTNKASSPVLFGIAAALALLVFYFAILSLAQSASHAVEQFKSMWYWIFALAAGFGIQSALYIKAKNACAKTGAMMPASMAASGGISGASMVACCAHHITDFVPLLGISAAAVFLAKYQSLFIILGVLSNINGTAFMLKNMQSHRIAENEPFYASLYRYNLSGAFKIIFTISVVLFVAAVIIGY